MLRVAYKLVSPFFDDKIKQKINLLSEGTWEELQSLFHHSQLEERFGGSASNVTSFWPPYESSTEYGEGLERFESSNNPEDLSISLENAPSIFYAQKSSNYLKLTVKQKPDALVHSTTINPMSDSDLNTKIQNISISKSKKTMWGLSWWIF